MSFHVKGLNGKVFQAYLVSHAQEWDGEVFQDFVAGGLGQFLPDADIEWLEIGERWVVIALRFEHWEWLQDVAVQLQTFQEEMGEDLVQTRDLRILEQ